MPKLVSEYDRIRTMISAAEILQMNEVLMDRAELEELEASADGDVLKCCNALESAFKAWKRPLDHVEAAAAFEAYAEAVVLKELQKKSARYGFRVRRVAEQKDAKTPDFECVGPEERFFIELKTLDMTGGIWSAKGLAERAFENQVRLDARRRPGVTFGEPLEIAPFGDKVGPLMSAAVLDIYIDRVNNNIAKSQVTTGPTFLMIFGQRLPLDTDDPSCLVPTYFFEAAHPTEEFPGECVSGDWWHVGFGRLGDQILTQSEFEGKGNLGGRLGRDGVLVAHPYLIGLSIFGRLMSGSQFRIYTLAQTDRDKADPFRFEEISPGDAAAVFSDAYNDNRNGPGVFYQFRRR